MTSILAMQRSQMPKCEVCGKKLRTRQRRFCSQRCKAISQRKEWSLITELRKTGRITLVQLTRVVEEQLGKKNVEMKIAEIIRLASETGRVEIVVGGGMK